MVNAGKDKKAQSKSPVQSNRSPPKTIDPSLEQQEEAKPEAGEVLGPPPRVAAGGDYFSGQHTRTQEQNPFEHSFASGSKHPQTPGGTTLPSITALTSASSALAGGGLTPGFWADTLRTGPLSPAMLSGPATGRDTSDYFSERHFTTGITPNESSLRSGLTPGGGGSMFPPTSPGSAAILDQIAQGGATPGTLDFHRTAIAAAAANKRDPSRNQLNITSQPQASASIAAKPTTAGQFDQHDANDAANGLFLLAHNARDPNPQPNHYAPVPQMSVHAHPQHSMQMGSIEASPQTGNRNGGSISTNSARGVSEMSGGSDENEPSSRPNTRGKGKRGAQGQANGRRKADETPAKAPANKKLKMEPEPSDAEEEPDMSKDEYNANGKKMTDEEKRKNFLERNRVAALKCRQRKKQWLANLQQKVEIYSSENDNLSAQISQLREEVVQLKTILLAHKDCPISHQQGIHGMGMEQLVQQNGGYPPQMGMNNPYGMGNMQAQVLAGAQLQGRRYS